jgi:hypothetical protein
MNWNGALPPYLYSVELPRGAALARWD